MNVLIYKSLLKSLAALSGSEVKRTTEFMLKFQDNPDQPGASLERVTKAKSDNLWSARISRDLRAIIYKEGDTWALLHAGHHDDAYNWAENRKVELNSKTGALQIVEVTESVEAALVDRQSWQADQRGLFDSHDDNYLLSLGLPPSWLPVTRKLLTEEDLLKIIEKLPEEVSERLLQVAVGELVTPPLPKVNASPLENEDTQRRFITVKSQGELEKILQAPLATWIGFLHPSQKRLATGNFNGPVKVTGSAGTGKTVVALHRARHLARKGKRVLLTTFVTTLCDNLTRNLKLLCTEEELNNIVVTTVAKQAGDILKQAGHRYEIVNDNEIKDLIDSFSFGSCPLEGLELWQEWQFVIQPNGISHWDEYRSVSRAGRGKGLSMRDRKNVWQVFEQVLHRLDTHHKLDWSHYFRRATIALESGRLNSPFDAVIVDEVQDLRPQELKFLSALAGKDGKDFMMVGDGNQRIYQGRFSFKSLGINIQGRSHILKVNYRTTEQIRRFADNLIATSSDDLNGGQESRKGTVSLLQGPHPILKEFSNPQQEAEFITAEVQKLTDRGLHADEIGIFARTKYLLQAVQTHLKSLNIPIVLLDSQSAGTAEAVHIGSMHRSKGLEFKAVFAIQVSEQSLPLAQAVNAETDKRTRQDSIERERHLLYVTTTRARDFAYISWSGQPSQFLKDLI
jgi:hypothetical protein